MSVPNNMVTLFNEDLDSFTWALEAQWGKDSVHTDRAISLRYGRLIDEYLLRREFYLAARCAFIHIKRLPIVETPEKKIRTIRKVLTAADRIYRDEELRDTETAKEVLFALQAAGEKAMPDQKPDKDLKAAWSTYTRHLWTTGKEELVREILLTAESNNPRSQFQKFMQYQKARIITGKRL